MRNKVSVAIVGCLTCLACIAQNGKDLGRKNKTIKLVTYERVKNKEDKVYYLLDVPNGYKNIITVFGDHEKEHQVWYDDSSAIYITDDEIGSVLNYKNIERLGTSQNTGKLFTDTLSLEGYNEDGNAWKEIKLGKVCIGYVNVSPRKREIYEASLNTIRKK